MGGKTADKPKRGRPSLYSEDMANEILSRIAAGETLTAICKDPHIVAIQTVFHWRATNPDFAAKYDKARECQADVFADELLDFVDEAQRARDEDGNRVYDPAIARLQVDVRKWTAAKLRPARYGDRVVNQHEGGSKPVSVVQLSGDLSDDEATRLYRELMGG